jgi:hypothetical protein
VDPTEGSRRCVAPVRITILQKRTDQASDRPSAVQAFKRQSGVIEIVFLGLFEDEFQQRLNSLIVTCDREQLAHAASAEMKLGWVEHDDAQCFCQWKPLALKLRYPSGADPVIAAHSPQLLPYATLPFEPHESANPHNSCRETITVRIA